MKQKIGKKGKYTLKAYNNNIWEIFVQIETGHKF